MGSSMEDNLHKSDNGEVPSSFFINQSQIIMKRVVKVSQSC